MWWTAGSTTLLQEVRYGVHRPTAGQLAVLLPAKLLNPSRKGYRVPQVLNINHTDWQLPSSWVVDFRSQWGGLYINPSDLVVRSRLDPGTYINWIPRESDSFDESSRVWSLSQLPPPKTVRSILAGITTILDRSVNWGVRSCSSKVEPYIWQCTSQVGNSCCYTVMLSIYISGIHIIYYNIES